MRRAPRLDVVVIGEGRHADVFAAAVDAADALSLQRCADAAPPAPPAGTIGAAIVVGSAHPVETATAALAGGRSVMLTAPFGSKPADEDALARLATDSSQHMVFGEPLCWSPVASAVGSALRDAIGGSARHRVDHASVRVSRPDDGADTLESLRVRATALVLTVAMPIWGEPDLAACGSGSVSLSGDGAPPVDVHVEFGPAAVSLQFAGPGLAVTGELWPTPGATRNGQELLNTPPPDELSALGYAELLRGFAGVATGRGGQVAPVGFGRLCSRVARTL